MASHVADLKVTTGRDNLMTLHERFLVISVPAQIFISADEEENDAEDDVELHRAENGDYCPGEDEDGCFEEGHFAGLILGFWIKGSLKMPELAAFGLVLRHCTERYCISKSVVKVYRCSTFDIADHQ